MTLRLESVTRRFGAHLALDAVSLHVRPGDCYGFLGHNGAGKTTSMRVALGLELPDAGRVVVDGFDAAEFPREARARMGGLIETPGFHGHLGGVANLALLARLQGMDGPAARRESERLVEAVGLARAGGKPVRAYSQGMRQRLGIAQALLGSPKLVLLDEPMNGLDPEGIEEMRRLLLRLTREEGRTVLLSSHQLSEIAGLCNRIGILREGRMLVEEETSKLLAAEEGRYCLATTDDAAAARILAAAGIGAAPHAAGGLEVSLGARDPSDVAADLVGRGVRLRTWAPRPPSLEEIYLRFAQGGGAQTERPTDREASNVAPPTQRIAPSRPVLRTMTYELRRWTSTPAVPVLLALPAFAGLASVWSQRGKLEADANAVAAGTLASTTNVTAFESVGVALQTAVPLLAVLVVGLASQSFAGELSRGTLRNLLLRPVTRFGVVAGKALAVFLAAFAGFVLLKLAVCGAAGHWFEYADVAEILPNGERMVLPGGAADAMEPEMRRTFLLLLPVIAAFSAIGLLAGAVARTGAGGLGLALGGVVLLVFLRIPAQLAGADGWMAATHLPLPLERGDSSVVSFFVQTTRVMSNAGDPYANLHAAAPLAWTALAFALTAAVLRKRSIR